MTKSIVNLTRVFMIITGLWKIPLGYGEFVEKYYKIYSITILSIYNLFSLSVVVRLLQLIYRGATGTKIFGCLTICFIVSIINYNVMIFLKNGIPYLFSDVIDEEKKLLNSMDEEINKTYLDQTKYYKITTTCQIISTVASGTTFAVSNFYKKITHSFVDDELFMYEMWYPFDGTKHINVVISINMIMVTIGICFNIVSHITPQTLIIYINSQLLILQIRLRKIFCEGNDQERIIQLKVKEIIRNHQSIIRFVEMLNNCLKNLVFMEFVLNSINIAAALLQVITVKTMLEMSFSVVHATLLVIQIFIQAWSANEIYIQSANVANAVYESNWIDQSEEVKKLLYIMLMRAQKPLALTIGPFRPINLESALITMKGAYTYSSVMMQKYT